MNDAGLMRGIERRGDLPRNGQSGGRVERARSLQPRRERLAAQELHGEEEKRPLRRFLAEQVVGRANIGVRNLAREQHFALEKLLDQRLAGVLRAQRFQRAVARLKVLIGGFVDLAHAAGSEKADDDEPSGEPIAWLEPVGVTSASRGRGQRVRRLQRWVAVLRLVRHNARKP